MSFSITYKRLISRITFLEKNLLPPTKIRGNYTKKESDLIRSYVLLAHAEIESYFEDVARNKVNQALKEWSTKRKKSNCLLAITSFNVSDIDWNKITKEEKKKIDFRINTTVLHFKNKLDINHGIKSDNICNILLPIGIEADQLDSTWLSTMDGFGNQRGTIAHSTSRVQEQIDLITEKNNINSNIIPEIGNLDLLIKKIK